MSAEALSLALRFASHSRLSAAKSITSLRGSYSSEALASLLRGSRDPVAEGESKEMRGSGVSAGSVASTVRSDDSAEEDVDSQSLSGVSWTNSALRGVSRGVIPSRGSLSKALSTCSTEGCSWLMARCSFSRSPRSSERFSCSFNCDSPAAEREERSGVGSSDHTVLLV